MVCVRAARQRKIKTKVRLNLRVKDVVCMHETGPELKKYVCGLCGYIYDPLKGDRKGKIPPGIAFEDLPEQWVCPLCGASKARFSPMQV